MKTKPFADAERSLVALPGVAATTVKPDLAGLFVAHVWVEEGGIDEAWDDIVRVIDEAEKAAVDASLDLDVIPVRDH